jgi:DeoR/GlpR family transcriptional regulator of sugar metabolism
MKNSPGLKIDERRKKILEVLSRQGSVRVSELSEELGATVVTIRSDLDALERDGYLERVQGGAVQSVKNFYNMGFNRRTTKNAEYKRAIARKVADMVGDGETLFMNSGTTTLFTAMELKRRLNLNILTNSLPVAMELGAVPTFRIMLLGGEINAQYSFTYGNDARERLKGFVADKAILSVDGVDTETGITTYHAEEATIDKLMMERARETVIVADHTKLGHASFSRISGAEEADYIVTNAEARGADAEALEKVGIKLVYAGCYK